MKKKMKISLTHLIELLLVSSVLVLILVIHFRGQMGYYLHPRMYKYTYFAVGVLTLLVARKVWVILKGIPKTPHVGWQHMVFLLPLIMLLVDPSDDTNAMLSNRTLEQSIGLKNEDGSGQELTGQSSELDTRDEEQSEDWIYDIIDDEFSLSEENMEQIKENMGIVEGETETALNLEDIIDIEGSESVETDNDASETVLVPTLNEVLGFGPDDDFYRNLLTIYENSEDYIGQPITIEGFVYTEPGYKSNTFVISRLLMTCCAADAMVTGLYVQTEEADQFVEGAWYRIDGLIISGAVYNPYMDSWQQDLVLSVSHYEEIEDYVNPYVYP